MGLATGQTKFLMVEMPPGHGKSFLTSKVFPAWYIMRNPHKRVLIAAHEGDYAAYLSGEAKKVVVNLGKIFGVTLGKDSDKQWSISGGSGYVVSRGMKGGVMGHRPHVVICDDLIKNDEAVRTQHRRDAAWDWFRTSCYTRLEPTGALVQVLTRWHVDDVAGRTMQDLPGKFRRVNLAALAEENDPLGREPGEALWPERFDRDAILEAKRVLDSRGGNWFSALYQQRPVVPTGKLYKSDSFRYWERGEHGEVLLYRQVDGEPVVFKESDCWRLGTMDLAISKEQDRDYTVLSEWIVTPDQDLLLDRVTRQRLEAPEQLALLKEVHAARPPVVTAIEKVQYQASLIQFALRANLSVEGWPVVKDKIARAQAPKARIAEGKIFWRRAADWLPDWEAELKAFDIGCEHDDQCDTLAIAVEKLLAGPTEQGGVNLVILGKQAQERAARGKKKPWQED